MDVTGVAALESWSDGVECNQRLHGLARCRSLLCGSSGAGAGVDLEDDEDASQLSVVQIFGMGWPIAIERLDCRLTRDELAQSVNQDVMLSGFVTSLLGRQNRSSPCRRGGFS